MNYNGIETECNEVSNLFAGNEEVSCTKCGETILLETLNADIEEEEGDVGALCPCCGEIILFK